MVVPRLYAVLLAGGFGTRFWPASRRALPKQFLPIAGKRSMIAETAARIVATNARTGLVPWERVLVVTADAHRALVLRALRKLPPENVLGEPVGRNTAACAAWAALEIERREKDAVQAVLPSDHVIEPPAEFQRVLRATAERAADGDALYTFGIRPTFPATGYGYIEAGERTTHDASELDVRRVARFVEKPDRARAEQFLASGRFFWNAGIFVWRSRAILSALREHAPSVVNPLASALAAATAPAREAAARAAYPGLPSVSIDVAVMEKARDVRVVPIDFRWNDVGSWTAIPDVQKSDVLRNTVAGGAQLLAHDARNCIAYGDKGELIALLGVSDLVVVHAGKVTLVCPRDRAQDVKQLVERLEREGPGFL